MHQLLVVQVPVLVRGPAPAREVVVVVAEVAAEAVAQAMALEYVWELREVVLASELAVLC